MRHLRLNPQRPLPGRRSLRPSKPSAILSKFAFNRTLLPAPAGDHLAHFSSQHNAKYAAHILTLLCFVFFFAFFHYLETRNLLKNVSKIYRKYIKIYRKLYQTRPICVVYFCWKDEFIPICRPCDVEAFCTPGRALGRVSLLHPAALLAGIHRP